MHTNGKKGQLTKYISENPMIEEKVNPSRGFEINNNDISDEFIYLTSRDLRAEDNFALNFVREKAKDFKVVHLKKRFETDGKNNFYLENIEILRKNYELQNIDFEIIDKSINEFLSGLNSQTIVIDFNPLITFDIFKNYRGKVYEVDSHNIIPARIASEKQEYSAFTFRKKVYDKIYEYLTDFPKVKISKNNGYKILEDFVKNKLKDYPKDKNNPDIRGTSNLSPYFNFGFLSPQRAAIEVLKSDAPDESKEVYLEELIVRAELSDNFCLYNKNYKSFDGAPDWAKKTLNYHIKDLRPHIFSKEQLENARSYDELWNATQKQLIEEGKIHGYLRMFWAKKLLEWTNTPYEAVDIAVYLNDKYAYDGESPNGYVGILWSIAGLHDRPFMNMPVTGEIRRLTGIKGKAEREKYIKRYL